MKKIIKFSAKSESSNNIFDWSLHAMKGELLFLFEVKGYFHRDFQQNTCALHILQCNCVPRNKTMSEQKKNTPGDVKNVGRKPLIALEWPQYSKCAITPHEYREE